MIETIIEVGMIGVLCFLSMVFGFSLGEREGLKSSIDAFERGKKYGMQLDDDYE